MNYSLEEIEKKRLLALQRKKQSQIQNNLSGSTIQNNSSSSAGNISSNATNAGINQNQSLSANKSFGHGPLKYADLKAKFRKDPPKNNGKFNKQIERFNPISTQNFFGNKKPNITGNCYMISDTRFTLETSQYFTPLVETLKTIPSRSYDMKTKSWNFLLKDYENVMEKIINFKSHVQITGLPKSVLQIFRKDDIPKDGESMELSDIDPQLLDSLMPFQREGICYGISKKGRCMIADDMGLGKTIQALGIAHYFRKSWPLLIVVPSSVRYQWADAIHMFLPSVPAHYVHHFTSTKDFIDNNKIVITTYDLLVRATNIFERQRFGFVILDESHALKSVKTARFKAAQCVVSQARHIILLSGTPALSRPIELYTQINLIMPNFIGYQEYGIRYCAGEKTSYGWNFSGSSNMQELQLLLKRTCVIRRLKNDVLNQLPSKKREVVMLDPDLIAVGTKDMIQISKQLERKVLTGMERHTALLQYYHESGIAKQKAICDYVSKLFKNNKKFVIFAHHQSVLEAICDVAESMDIKYIRIDGKTNPERRKYLVDKFQECDSYIAAVLSIATANAGITLTAAQLVVFAELFWNPGILCQAEDRVHRIGQNDNVTIQYLVAKQTADDYLWPLIQRKMNVLNEVGLDQDFSLTNIDVTRKSTLSSKQKPLEFFTNKGKYKHETDESVVENNENKTEDSVLGSQSSITGEYKELLELDNDSFDFCDWSDME
ncbi:unnamed protein product [Xylocopa violacea]